MSNEVKESVVDIVYVIQVNQSIEPKILQHVINVLNCRPRSQNGYAVKTINFDIKMYD